MIKYLLLFLVGCGGYIKTNGFSKATNLCEHNGGLDYVYTSVVFSDVVKCNNTAEFKDTYFNIND